MKISIIAPDAAAIGRYVTAAARPPPLLSGTAGGSWSTISPWGISGPDRCGGRRPPILPPGVFPFFKRVRGGRRTVIVPMVVSLDLNGFRGQPVCPANGTYGRTGHSVR